jgi:RNA polymerase sigma-70 factor, ECF subfamily
VTEVASRPKPTLVDLEPLASPAVEAPPFRALFEAEFSYVFRTLHRLGVRRADLEDLTHEVFVAVHRAYEQYDPRRPIRPWLFGIAFRIALDYRRRARYTRERPDDGVLEPVDTAPLADERLAKEQARRLVIAALDDVELDRRAMLVLHDLDGQSMPEIAHALGIPLNTAYSRLRLAREQLKAAVLRRSPPASGPRAAPYTGAPRSASRGEP